MIELMNAVDVQLQKLSTSKNIKWENSEIRQDFLQIVSEDFPKHQAWIQEGISMLEQEGFDNADLALAKIVVGFRNLYLDCEVLDELLITFSREYHK